MKRIAAVSIMVVLMVVVYMLPACEPKAAAPVGPPQVVSFTAASDNVAEDECPVFNFEVDNCSAITITQDGEKIMEIEITGTGTPAASLQSRHGQAYALTETQPGVETHYCPGVYPIGFKGASNGKPSKTIWKFGETKKDGSAEIEVRSWDGQVAKAEVAYNIVPAWERPSDQRPVITAPDCAKQDDSETIEPEIKSFTVKNPTVEIDEPLEFEFEVNNASMVKIEQGDEDVFVIAVIVLIVRERRHVFHQPRQGEAYALTENQPGVEPRYCPGIYPVGFKGASNGKPSKTIWEFGDNSEQEASASITVCSPSGHALTDVLPFFVRCPEGCDCITQGQAEAQHYTTKCSNIQCGYDSTQPPIDGYPKEYCFRKCPEECECLQRGYCQEYHLEECPPGAPLACAESGPDGLPTKVCCGCPDGCWCVPKDEAEEKDLGKCSRYVPCSGPGEPAERCYTCPTWCQCKPETWAQGLGYEPFKCFDKPCGVTYIGDWTTRSLSTASVSPEQQTVDQKKVNNYCYAVCPEVCECLTESEASQYGFSVEDRCTDKVCGYSGVAKMYCYPNKSLRLPLIDCSLSSTTVPSGGGQVTVYWTSQDADKVTMTIGSGVPSQVPLNGSLGTNVTEDTCFTFTAENESGTATAECCVDVQAYQPPPAPPPTPPEPPCEPESPPPLAL